MNARATDWGLALLVALAVASGALSMVSGDSRSAWIWWLHGWGGVALGLLALVKLRRVRTRLVPRRWDRRTWAGMLATALVLGALASGVIWSIGGSLYWLGWNLLNWHIALGVALGVGVGLHALLRARPLRLRHIADRRQALRAGAMGVAAIAAMVAQRPAARAFGWRGAQRRWTGSYEAGSFAGNAFPATSWVADRPRPIDPAGYRLVIEGLVARPAALDRAALELGDELEATLDCTGGFFSTQLWRGASVSRLLEAAQPLPGATHLRVVSHTGYRWSFPLAEARELLLATHVGDEALSHGHGAPLRLVAPGRRGFQWIKWVERVELHRGPDLGAAASTVWSSWTPEGRGTEER